MLPEERRFKIIELLNTKGCQRVSDLADDLKVSEVTIRQDLDMLESQKILRRIHGGAILNSKVSSEIESVEIIDFNEEKDKIGKAAAETISDGDTVIFGAGTSTLIAVKHLANIKNLNIVTNSLKIAEIAGKFPGISVILTGGSLRSSQMSLINPFADSVLKQINADIAIIGAGGILTEHGITCPNMAEAEINRMMLKSAKKKIVLADSTKIGNISLAKIADLNEIDLLITGREADSVELTVMREWGLKIQVV